MNALNDWVQRLFDEIGEMSPLTQLGCGALLLIFVTGAITFLIASYHYMP